MLRMAESLEPDADKPWLDLSPHAKIKGLPDFGWRVRFDHVWKEQCSPFSMPRLSHIPGLLTMGIRYTWTWMKKYIQGKRLFIDNLNLVPWRPIYGAPIGGIGTGTIGRGYCGEFCRFQMVPGMYTYNTVESNQFIVRICRPDKPVFQQVLCVSSPASGFLSSWTWNFPREQAHYHALYPRSWTVYELPEQGVRLICRQVSPIIPHNYKESSYPCAVFVWSIENLAEEPAEISLMFTFTSGQGEIADRAADPTMETFTMDKDNVKVMDKVTGVMIHQKFGDMPCTYAISAREKSAQVSYRREFNPEGNGKEVWQDLLEDGHLDGEKARCKAAGLLKAAAVCCYCEVPPGGSTSTEFSLAWDMPIIEFGSKKLKYARRYTRWFGRDGSACPDISAAALQQYRAWERQIDQWQRPLLESQFPAWYKSALFNELYFISDGGTVWVDPLEENKDLSPIVREYGRFAYLEGHEYRMYNTYDVHHNASFALIQLWPKLQLSLQYDIAAAVAVSDPRPVMFCMSGEVTETKARDVVPHDMGDPDDEPWEHMNAYIIHPTQEWKDLNIKFVLQVFRDYAVLNDSKFLEDMYPVVKTVMESSLRWDVDDDGLIDNAGFPDQTYDAWTMQGASAYCGGMWLAALKIFCDMTDMTGNHDDKTKFAAILEKGKESFEKKLWNGTYYNFDCSKSRHHDSIMSDQLAGQWYLKAANGRDSEVFPRDHLLSALDAIYKHNVLSHGDGTMGAINGMRPDGKKDQTSIQSEEFWTGVTYALAATMIQEQSAEESDKTLLDHAWQTAYGAYNVCYQRWGLGFQTPEAYTDDGRFRSLGYMRPLCIWSMQYALEKFHPHLCSSQ